MTYRDDLDALAARQASLQAEVDRKQRELTEIRGMLAEAGRVEQAERQLDRVPDLRRTPRRHLLACTLAVTLGSGTAVGYAATVPEPPRPEPAMKLTLVRLKTNRAHEAQRVKAELEALRTLGLLPAVDPDPRATALAKLTRRTERWVLGSQGYPWKSGPVVVLDGGIFKRPSPPSLAADKSAPVSAPASAPASAAGEDQR